MAFAGAKSHINKLLAKVFDAESRAAPIALATRPFRCAQHATPFTSAQLLPEINLLCKSKSDHSDFFSIFLTTPPFFYIKKSGTSRGVVSTMFHRRAIFFRFVKITFQKVN
jgi:hypothetical protein